MKQHLRQSWQHLRHGIAGQRFSDYHEWRRQHRAHPAMRSLRLALGVLVALVGIVLMPAPGPGMLIVAIGACLMAGESRTVATALDRFEQLLHRLLRRFRRS